MLIVKIYHELQGKIRSEEIIYFALYRNDINIDLDLYNELDNENDINLKYKYKRCESKSI
ncbi:hypothetical protein SAMN05192533_11770 [Mesobacillus persicus]|uniref:Uncharacterized protein n=1 Tax=Mesobacillus persicus TaxID=930146 RepID=A0A1H8IK70_9BACI|nr:hypothetical protein SAMN05192533_11770 [Mesobacillus persicus]